MPTFQCQNPNPCPRTFTVSDEHIGRKANCPVCGFRNTVYSAAEQAEIDKFRAEHGSDTKTQDSDGNTLLHTAVKIYIDPTKNWDIVIVKYLVSRGADVNAKNRYDSTPLHQATLSSNLEAVKYLVSHKADVNAKDSEGNTPLRWAVIYNETIEIAFHLISNRANVNDPQKNGYSQLHSVRNVEFAKLLIANGADVNAEDEDRATPLHSAVRRLAGIRSLAELTGNNQDEDVQIEIVKHLLSDQRVKVSAKDKDGVTPLHAAVHTGCLECVRLLVDGGADIHAKDKRDETPLDWARAMEKPAIAEYLSSLLPNYVQFTDEEKREIDRYFSYHFSCPKEEVFKSLTKDELLLDAASKGSNGSVAVIKYLLHEGADIHARLKITSETPLHVAARRGNIEVAKYLVSQGANVNATDHRDETPLHNTAWFDQLEIAKFLIANGAKIRGNFQGCTPTKAAEIEGNTTVYQYLKKEESKGGCIGCLIGLAILVLLFCLCRASF